MQSAEKIFIRILRLTLEDAPLQLRTPTVSVQRTVGCHDPVARDHHRNGIGAHRLPDGTRRTGPPDCRGQTAVGGALAGSDTEKPAPYGKPELRSDKAQTSVRALRNVTLRHIRMWHPGRCIRERLPSRTGHEPRQASACHESTSRTRTTPPAAAVPPRYPARGYGRNTRRR